MTSDVTAEFVVDFEPLGFRARVAPGTTLMDAARQAGVRPNAICGGAGTCGACRMRVMDGQVSPPTSSEERFLADGMRLACQTRVLGDVRVDIPPSTMAFSQRMQVEGHERAVEFDPVVRAFDVTLPPADLTDLRADATRLCDALEQQHGIAVGQFEHAAMRQLSILLRENEWTIRIVIMSERDGDGNRVIAVTPPGIAPLGLAVDIGTTKVAAYLVNLESGETLAVGGAMNPQIAYGEDVMARIAYAMKDDAQAREIQSVLAGGLNDLVGQLCAQAECSREEIVEAVLVGNTCMHHLAVGLPVAQLGLAPYVPALADSYDLRALEMGLHLAPGANVHLLPNIAGFVGADHVAMVLATGIYETDEITVGLDIGTNTEISLAVDGRLLSCSCASGPAFEGAHIRDGMRAAPGAIERIRLADGQVEYQTIDDASPVGICGSGILDAVAELRKVGVLRLNGSMQPDSHPRVRGTGRNTEFVLVPAGEQGAARDIVVNRKDVNEIQLAKAAIRAGIEVLLNTAGLEVDQVERVVVAGAFGTYLDVDSALAVEMFPPLPRERFSQVGNAAGMGAKLVLLSRLCREIAGEIARRVEYVELTTSPHFVQVYTGALMLP